MKKIIIITLISAALAFGCSKAASSLNDGYAKTTSSSQNIQYGRTMAYSYEDAAEMRDTIRAEGGSDSDSAILSNQERKLVHRTYIRIRVENLDKADVVITDLLNKYDAYSASTEVTENSRNYSLRVPASQYKDFLKDMNGIGRLIRRSDSTEDVTLHYYDLEGRLEMKKELLKTFQSYLTRARNIEEILSVEARIAELQNDIEGTGVQLRHLANRVDYATIDLNLLGPASASKPQTATLGERITGLFGNFGYFLSTVLVIIIGIVVFGVPLMLLLTLLFWLLFGKIGLLRKLWVVVKVKK